ncbi:myosin phosphatase Rho-interacting protein-like isoform X2 [Carcharodon carcharias]|uniref:myosin phosphatase Rho-interacting protein-like isoform X2 n=1 Tax=Carcharodon carcharias TaxID=13397 RepID=UPI001B7DD13C|nr:myosin phosphatase Rho-interacting protein-like isoform X2 [Carcharodon carcharias]
MSAKENAACRKFQANIFNQSKCQNCFKSRESHLTSDQDLNQAKPIYGGWLLLAPEGTDFENPVQRSRKWQRRFFLLYEHGLLRYALDDSPSTLPQGTINMNLSTDVTDGESKTAQKNSLCIIMPEKQHFIRAENKETINGWFEMLVVYPRTNKQNQKKKRKVEPPTPQEPGPAKVAVTSSCMPNAEKVPSTRSTLWQEQEQLKNKNLHVISNMMKSPSQNQSSIVTSSGPSAVPREAAQSVVNGNEVDSQQKKRVESGYFSLEKLKSDSKQLTSPGSSTPSRRSQVIEQFEALEIEQAQQIASSSSSESSIYNKRCRGRSEKRSYPRKRDFVSESDQINSAPDISAVSLPQYRRAKSLDRRASESTVTPDLLNFKKGWMTKLSADGQWKKHWFVLTDQVLKYYRDSAAEEAVDLDGEIDLSSCYDVTEYEVQRNYGFQIHTKAKVYMLSAMTSGIRRNWIQAIMKNVHPVTTPDVTRNISEEKLKVRTLFEGASVNGAKPAITLTDGAGLEAEQKKSRARERRKEGRSRTFDWAEFRPAQQRPSGGYVHRPTSLYLRTMTNFETDSQELERDRARRREERRKRFETTDVSFSLGCNDVNRMEVDGATISPRGKNVDVEIEHRWQQVECTPLREEKQVPILTTQTSSEGRPPSQDLALMLDKELEQSHQEVFRLHEQNRELQGQLRAALEREHNARDGYVLQETCERGFTAMEESHQKVIEELQKQHQRELEKLQQEKDRLLAEETAATIAAIEAMKNAHREELERELEKTNRSQISGMNADIEALGRQHKEEMGSVQRELQVLSEQYSHKCLENSHLAQALEAERQALRQCQRENQELNAHNQELNNRLAAEFARLRALVTEEGKGEDAGSPLSLGKDVYELEVLLRVKESEIQYLKQEINSLKDELQTALRDKKYATDKYKGIYTELSIVRAKADCDVNRLKEQLKTATEALGDKTIDCCVTTYDIMKSRSNPDFLKNNKPTSSRLLRTLRSKSLKEGLTVQERMKLFEPKD